MDRGSLVRLYPDRWRRRYEAEFRALLEEEPLTPGLLLDVIAGAFAARLAPYPIAPETAMTARRLQTASALLAILLVLPSLVLLSAALVRGLQPVGHQPADAASAIVEWFASLHAGELILFVGPAVALVLAVAALWRRLRDDAELRADLRLFGEVGGRLLRRPVLIAGAIAAAGSLGVLVFFVDHWFAG